MNFVKLSDMYIKPSFYKPPPSEKLTNNIEFPNLNSIEYRKKSSDVEIQPKPFWEILEADTLGQIVLVTNDYVSRIWNGSFWGYEHFEHVGNPDKAVYNKEWKAIRFWFWWKSFVLETEYTGPGGVEKEVEKASKDEFTIAKWIKKNVPTKKTKFLNHNVEYFTSSKALDALMASKFGQGDNCLFPTREIAIEFLDSMLVHKFFHRAKKVPVTEAELKRGKKTDKKIEDDEKKESSVTSTKKKEEKVTDAESSHVEGKKEKTSEKDKEKKKRKIRLDMHPDQIFVDGGEAYVWIYDPIPMHYWLFGALLVFGAIVICLFPLWPPSLRKGVYYLSIAAAGFLVFILGLVVLRFIVFCIVWLLTRSKHHFWLFPNLTEDVGFLASFWPLYKHDYIIDGSVSKDKKRKRRKDKDSDAEDDTNVPLLEPEKIENIKEHDTETPAEGLKISRNDSVEKNEEKKGSTPSESESESSQRSSTGKDFEIVEPEDVDTS